MKKDDQLDKLQQNKKQDIIDKAKSTLKVIESLKQKIGFYKDESNNIINRVLSNSMHTLEYKKNKSLSEENSLKRAKNIREDIKNILSTEEYAKNLLKALEKQNEPSHEKIKESLLQARKLTEQIDSILSEKSGEKIIDFLINQKVSLGSGNVDYNKEISESPLESTNETLKPFKKAERYLKAMTDLEVTKNTLKYYNSTLAVSTVGHSVLEGAEKQYMLFYAEKIINHSNKIKEIMGINQKLSLEDTKNHIKTILRALQPTEINKDQNNIELFQAARKVAERTGQALDNGELAMQVLKLLKKDLIRPIVM